MVFLLSLILSAALPGPRPQVMTSGEAPRMTVDTILEVTRGDRLVLEGFTGRVTVEGWSRSSLGLSAESEENLLFRVERSGSRLELRVVDEKGRNRPEDLKIDLPEWMDLELSGRELDAEVRGLNGRVSISNLEGDLTLQDLGGEVTVSSTEGTIEAYRLTGVARLRSGDDDLRLVDCSASLDLETVDGDIEMDGIRATRVSARTTEGDIELRGRIAQGAQVDLHSHDGDLSVFLEPPVHLDVTVLAYRGSFESDFPVKARGFKSGQPMEFSLGDGGASLILEAFDGEIRLLEAHRSSQALFLNPSDGA